MGEEGLQIRIGCIEKTIVCLVCECDIAIKIQLPVIPGWILEDDVPEVVRCDRRRSSLEGFHPQFASRSHARIYLLVCPGVDRSAVHSVGSFHLRLRQTSGRVGALAFQCFRIEPARSGIVQYSIPHAVQSVIGEARRHAAGITFHQAGFQAALCAWLAPQRQSQASDGSRNSQALPRRCHRILPDIVALPSAPAGHLTNNHSSTSIWLPCRKTCRRSPLTEAPFHEPHGCRSPTAFPGVPAQKSHPRPCCFYAPHRWKRPRIPLAARISC